MTFPVFVTVHPSRQSSTFRQTLASGVQVEFAKGTAHAISEDDFASIAKDIGASLSLCSEDGSPDLEATGNLVLHIAGEIISYSEETNMPASLPYHQVEALKEFQAKENAELDAEEDEVAIELEPAQEPAPAQEPVTELPELEISPASPETESPETESQPRRNNRRKQAK